MTSARFLHLQNAARVLICLALLAWFVWVSARDSGPGVNYFAVYIDRWWWLGI